MLVEERRHTLVAVHPAREPRHQVGDELDDALVVLGRVDHQAVDVGGEQVAHRAEHQVEVLVDEGRGSGRGCLLVDPRPQLGEEADVVVDLALGHALARGPDDETALFRTLGDDRAGVALGPLLDPAGDADVRVPGM